MSTYRYRLMLYPLIILAVLYGFLVFLALRSDRMIFQPPPASYNDATLADFDILDGRFFYTPPHSIRVFKLHSGKETLTALYTPALSSIVGVSAPGKLHIPNAPPEPPPYTLLMSHGNAEDIGENRELYAQYSLRGFAVFAYDARVA